MLILLSLLAVTSGALVFEDNRCNEGPAYWCQSAELAKSCDALSYCQIKVWGEEAPEHVNVETAPVGNYVTCKSCTWILGLIEQHFMNNETTTHALDFLKDRVCSYIPETYKSTCVTFIDNYGHIAVEAIFKKMEPRAMCVMLDQCDPLAQLNFMPHSVEATCAPCKSQMKELLSTNDGWLRTWQTMCNYSSKEEECVQLSQMLMLINNAVLNDAVCEAMEMC